MKGTVVQNFDGYSDEAIQSIIDQSPGKPVTDGPDGKQMGKIISGKLLHNTNDVQFEIELDEFTWTALTDKFPG